MEKLRFIKNLFWVCILSLIVNSCCTLFDGNIDLNWFEWLLGLIILIGLDLCIMFYTKESFWTMKDIINKIKKH